MTTTIAGLSLASVVRDRGLDVVCKALGCSGSAIRHWITGERLPKIEAREAASREFGIPVTDWCAPSTAPAPVEPMHRVGRMVAVRDLTVAQFERLLGRQVVYLDYDE